MKKILILGTYGMLGHQLFLQLQKNFEVYGTVRKFQTKYETLFPKSRIFENINAEEISNIESVIQDIKPDIILNCIGIIKQRKTKKSQILNISINALFPHKLAKICEEKNIKIIHFSTDCVFSGKKGNYNKTDFSDAEDLYGRTKYLGELDYPHCLTIRSSIIGPELYNKKSLWEWVLSQKGNTIEGFTEAIYSGITTVEMSNIIENIITNFPDLHGVYQIASQSISKHHLLELINRLQNLNLNIIPSKKVICDRSLNGSEFYKKTNYLIPNWETMIQELINESKI